MSQSLEFALYLCILIIYWQAITTVHRIDYSYFSTTGNRVKLPVNGSVMYTPHAQRLSLYTDRLQIIDYKFSIDIRVCEEIMLNAEVQL